MPKYQVEVYATPVGSAHMNNSVHRTYTVEAETPEAARTASITLAYKDGDIEHINPRTVRELNRITVGTSYFVSAAAAKRYFAYEGATREDIDRKVAEGLIHIGKPTLKPGQLLSVIDNGTRYAIEG